MWHCFTFTFSHAEIRNTQFWYAALDHPLPARSRYGYTLPGRAARPGWYDGDWSGKTVEEEGRGKRIRKMNETEKTFPPGPGGLPVVSSVLQLVSLARDPFMFMTRLNKTYGSIVATQGLVKVVFIFDPQYNRQVLNNTTLFYSAGDTKESSPLRIPEDSALRRLTGGLNLINGDDHKFQRKLMQPAFHKKQVEGYRDTMVELVERRLSEWQPGQVRNILLEMRQLTLSISLQILLGLDPEVAGEKVRTLMEEWMSLFLSLGVQLPLNLPGLPYHRILKLSSQIEIEFKAMLASKRANDTGSNDVLAALIKAQAEDGARLSSEQLIGEIATLFVAGHETTASALTWTLFLLEQHPQVLADLLDELDAKLHGDAPAIEQLNELPLLDAVIKESMRLLPPGIFFMRYTTAPTELGTYRIPAKTNVVYSPAVTHRNPALYPDPARFRPERWQQLDPSPYEYMPFSGGPRMCIGATFATTEIKIVLSMLLQRFRLSLLPGARVDRSGIVTSAPKKGLPALIHSQDRQFSKSTVYGTICDAVNL